MDTTDMQAPRRGAAHAVSRTGIMKEETMMCVLGSSDREIRRLVDRQSASLEGATRLMLRSRQSSDRNYDVRS
jgi:hypothetical protein